jgi:hypothetical protein
VKLFAVTLYEGIVCASIGVAIKALANLFEEGLAIDGVVGLLDRALRH